MKCCSLFFHLFFLRLLHFHMCIYSCGYLYPFVKKRQSDESMMTRMSDDVCLHGNCTALYVLTDMGRTETMKLKKGVTARKEGEQMAVSYTHLDVYKRQVHVHLQRNSDIRQPSLSGKCPVRPFRFVKTAQWQAALAAAILRAENREKPNLPWMDPADIPAGLPVRRQMVHPVHRALPRSFPAVLQCPFSVVSSPMTPSCNQSNLRLLYRSIFSF